MYIGLLLSALNKLPLKLPGSSTGRRHDERSSTSEPVTLDDVAGVDEAKEELAEVVVRSGIFPVHNSYLPFDHRALPFHSVSVAIRSQSCRSD